MLSMTEKCNTNSSGQLISREFLTSVNVYSRGIWGFPYLPDSWCTYLSPHLESPFCTDIYADLEQKITIHKPWKTISLGKCDIQNNAD